MRGILQGLQFDALRQVAYRVRIASSRCRPEDWIDRV